MGANISKLARTTLETPDLARQSAYFEHVLGLAQTGESATARFSRAAPKTIRNRFARRLLRDVLQSPSASTPRPI